VREVAMASAARTRRRLEKECMDVFFMAGWNGVFRLKDSVFRFFTA
jgi:hypothetical protein